MKITNKTDYSTVDLRRFVARAAKDVFTPEEWKRKRIHLRVLFRRSRTRPSGRASLGGSWMCIQLPGPRYSTDPDFRLELAHLIVHELAHCRGTDHEQMRGAAKYRWVSGWKRIVAWADDLPLRIKEPKPKPSRMDHVFRRIGTAEAAVATWTRKHRLATTKLNLWKRRLAALRRRLDSRIAAENGSPHEAAGEVKS